MFLVDFGDKVRIYKEIKDEHLKSIFEVIISEKFRKGNNQSQ